MTTWNTVLLVVLLFGISASYASNEPREIVLVADKWCPYNCTPESENPGLLVEIAQYAFQKSGYSVSYIIRPWNRSIVMVRQGKYDGIIGSGRGETPDFVFPDEPLASIKHKFFVNDTSSWQYEGLDSLSHIKLGVIKNYSYGDLYDRYIKANQSNPLRVTALHGEDALSRLAELLKRGRIDAFVEEQNIVSKYLMHPNAYTQIKSAGVGSKEDIYIAFSPNKETSKEYARLLSEGYRELVGSGGLLKLMRKYALQNSN